MGLRQFVLALASVWLTLPQPLAMADSSLIEVDLQLVLAVDISFSISLDEQDIQRRGYISAFRDPEVIHAITSGFRGRIAVTYLEWAGQDTQVQIVPWTLIYDLESGSRFAQRLEQTPTNRQGRTSLSQALNAALGLLRQSPFQSSRRVLDISSDGFNNSGPRIDRLRDTLVYHGVTINGLPLMQGKDTGPDSHLDTYFEDCVIGGLGAFVLPMRHWKAFGPTLTKKLISEIAGPMRTPPKARITPAANQTPTDPPMDCLFGEKQDLQNYIQQLEDAVGKDRAPRWIPREQDWPMPD